MLLEINHSYKITLRINNTTLTYTCKVVGLDDTFVSFIDKFGGKYSYNKSLIISFEEIQT